MTDHEYRFIGWTAAILLGAALWAAVIYLIWSHS